MTASLLAWRVPEARVECGSDAAAGAAAPFAGAAAVVLAAAAVAPAAAPPALAASSRSFLFSFSASASFFWRSCCCWAAGVLWEGPAAEGEDPSYSLFRGLGLQEQPIRLQIGWEGPTQYALRTPSLNCGSLLHSGHRQDLAVGVKGVGGPLGLGGCCLSELARALSLDCFPMLSQIDAIAGTPGQAPEGGLVQISPTIEAAGSFSPARTDQAPQPVTPVVTSRAGTAYANVPLPTGTQAREPPPAPQARGRATTRTLLQKGVKPGLKRKSVRKRPRI